MTSDQIYRGNVQQLSVTSIPKKVRLACLEIGEFRNVSLECPECPIKKENVVSEIANENNGQSRANSNVYASQVTKQSWRKPFTGVDTQAGSGGATWCGLSLRLSSYSWLLSYRAVNGLKRAPLRHHILCVFLISSRGMCAFWSRPPRPTIETFQKNVGNPWKKRNENNVTHGSCNVSIINIPVSRHIFKRPNVPFMHGH